MARQVENWLQAYLQLVDQTEPPQRFHLWSAITIIGAMMGRKCTVQLGPEMFFPNLYTILIGPPGVRKGTAIKYATDLLDEVRTSGSCRAPDAVTKEQLIAEMEAAQDSENVDGKLLVHSSLFVVAPELVVFIKENDHERLGYLCQLYDGLDRFEYKTKTSTNQFVVNPGLWLLGATTPNWIEIAMKQLGVGGGMTSRTVFVYASKKGHHISATKMRPFDQTLRAKLITDLQIIKQMAGSFRLTEEADTVYSEWYEDRYLATGIDDTRFASYWERYPSMVIKVAMIMSASKRDDMMVTGVDIRNSINTFEAIHPEMPQAFGGLGQNVLGSQTEMIRNLLREKGQVTKSYIMKTLRMHISEWDYMRCKNSLLAERFCTRSFVPEFGEEILTFVATDGGEE
jgi:hypothetical protein